MEEAKLGWVVLREYVVWARSPLGLLEWENVYRQSPFCCQKKEGSRVGAKAFCKSLLEAKVVEPVSSCASSFTLFRAGRAFMLPGSFI